MALTASRGKMALVTAGLPEAGSIHPHAGFVLLK